MAIVARLAAAARAGVHLLQIRERRLDDRLLVDTVRRCVHTAQGTCARVIVNDRVDIALAAGASGVHLPARSTPTARVRRIVPAGFLVGRSVHAPEEAMAEGAAADYLLFGTTFETPSKPAVAAAGLDALKSAVLATPCPVLAVGGVTPERMGAVAGAGAAGFAAIAMFAQPALASLGTLTATLSAAFDTRRTVP